MYYYINMPTKTGHSLFGEGLGCDEVVLRTVLPLGFDLDEAKTAPDPASFAHSTTTKNLYGFTLFKVFKYLGGAVSTHPWVHIAPTPLATCLLSMR